MHVMQEILAQFGLHACNMKFNPQNEEYVYVQLYNTACPQILTELFQS